MSIDVRKTYKLFIGGKFPRSESGRAYQPQGCRNINVARASRKDLRDAVTSARAAAAAWTALTAYHRGQVLYRLAEMLQTRATSLAEEIAQCTTGDAAAAGAEVAASIDLVTWYAGLPDKLQSLLGSQNAVSGPFFNFTTVEPTGTVAIAAPPRPALLGLLGLLLPVLAGGNTAVVAVSEPAPLPGLALGELLAVSDFPGGVVNLLAGMHEELLPQMASHRDVDGLLLAGPPRADLGRAAADSVKRVRYADLPDEQWLRLAELQRLAWVEPFVEVKTFWHPVAP
jgi:acyl-CoA reductase-like NAD-dependent aldehyde dehydrogenase